jgi:flavodoxin
MAQKILVVSYSRSGNTRTIAQALASDLRCDSEEIVAKSLTGFSGLVTALIEAMRHKPARIETTSLHVSSYDVVVVGTPVWAWSVSSPVRAFLIENKKKLPRVAFFCTLGHRGDDSAFAQMQELAGRAPLATIAVTASDVIAGRFRDRLAKFEQTLAAAELKTGRNQAA